MVILLQVYCYVCQWKNSENREIFDEIVHLAAYFLDQPVYT